jgi:membrane protease YdiL (CAAX protease family)
MSSFESTWDYGDYRPLKVLLTFILVIGGFILGNFPILFLYPLDRGKTMTDLVSYFGFTKLFLLQMIPFFFGLIGFFISTRFIHKVSLITWFTSRAKIDINRIFFSFVLWATLIILPTLVDWYISPSKYTLQFEWRSFFTTCILLGICLPFQVLFEELLFRGFLFQGLAKRTKSILFTIILSGVMFGLMHIGNPEVTAQGYWLLGIYITLGIALSLIAFLDQGIEIPFGFHLANNFVTGILVTSSDQAFQTKALLKMDSLDFTVASFAWLLVSLAIFLLVVSRRFRWKELRVKRNNH